MRPMKGMGSSKSMIMQNRKTTACVACPYQDNNILNCCTGGGDRHPRAVNRITPPKIALKTRTMTRDTAIQHIEKGA